MNRTNGKKNSPRTGVSSSNSTRTRPLRNCPGKKRSEEFSKRIRNLSNLRPPWGAMEPTSLKRDISCSLLAPPSRRNVYKLLDDAVLLLFLFGCCLLNWCEGENGRDGRVGDDAAQRIQMRLGWILAAPVVICQPFETRMTMGFFLESVRSRPQTCRCTCKKDKIMKNTFHSFRIRRIDESHSWNPIFPIWREPIESQPTTKNGRQSRSKKSSQPRWKCLFIQTQLSDTTRDIPFTECASSSTTRHGHTKHGESLSLPPHLKENVFTRTKQEEGWNKEEEKNFFFGWTLRERRKKTKTKTQKERVENTFLLSSSFIVLPKPVSCPFHRRCVLGNNEPLYTEDVVKIRLV